MKAFQRPGGIDRISVEARIVYSVFCVFLLIGIATSVWFYLDDHLGARPSEAARYYLGEPPEAAEPAGGGPALALPAEERAPLVLAKPKRQVMETFHFHLFSTAVCLMIIAHLFMLCGRPGTTAKLAIILASSLATLLHVAAPPLIAFASPAFAALMFPSAVLMLLGWTGMTLHALIEMWRPRLELDSGRT